MLSDCFLWWYYWNWWPFLLKLSCFDDITGISGHLCWNCLLFWWYYWNCWTSLLKLSFALMMLLELVTISVETVFCFDDITGIGDHQSWNFLFIMMSECITMDWVQCRDYKYDTLTHDSIQWNGYKLPKCCPCAVYLLNKVNYC